MNKTFIFQTGHGKGLARAEIEALLPNSIIDETEDGFVIEAEIQDTKKLQDQMGSIVRITEVIQTGPARMPLNFEEWVTKAIETNANKDTKFKFGLSMHPKSEKILKTILIGSKKKLKDKLKLRFVNKDFQNLSSVQAWHEGLLQENAIELQLFKSEDKWYLTKTLTIQDFEWYSKRDYDRPAKSAKEGMFPPKLAQILINISKPEKTIVDPFCGSGTVLQEAWLMGYKVEGSDISESTIENCKINIDWLKHEANLDGNPKIFVKDATKLTANDLPSTSFTIVTETWLGPLMTKPPTTLERQKLQREIEQMYEDFFSNLKNLNIHTRIVFTAGYYKEKNDRFFLPKLPEILAKYTKIIPLSDHERPSLFYERKNQIVGREIWMVEV